MEIAVIGGGPAGLRAAEVAASAGARVTVFDAQPSVGRKFLVAGRGGLNLTNAEPLERFASRYSGPPEMWRALLAGCEASALQQWARQLGIETFTASSGRIYPREMKAAPLLRRWLLRMRSHGVEFAMRHRWTGLHAGPPWQLEFRVGDLTRSCAADAVILALGGASWPITGSDGAWVKTLRMLGIQVAPLQPANCGWEVAWSADILARAEGQPLKNIVVRATGVEAFGELLVTNYGLEGGAIYTLGAALRRVAEPQITIDFKPTFTSEQLVAKMGSVRSNFLAEARSRWRLSNAAHAVMEFAARDEPPASATALATLVKTCPIQLRQPRPISEAISSAGGVLWSELDEKLMLRRLPGVFVAGEMIDWEAPTGGYLIQGCFATGTHSAHGAVAWLKKGIHRGRNKFNG